MPAKRGRKGAAQSTRERLPQAIHTSPLSEDRQAHVEPKGRRPSPEARAAALSQEQWFKGKSGRTDYYDFATAPGTVGSVSTGDLMAQVDGRRVVRYVDRSDLKSPLYPLGENQQSGDSNGPVMHGAMHDVTSRPLRNNPSGHMTPSTGPNQPAAPGSDR